MRSILILFFSFPPFLTCYLVIGASPIFLVFDGVNTKTTPKAIAESASILITVHNNFVRTPHPRSQNFILSSKSVSRSIKKKVDPILNETKSKRDSVRLNVYHCSYIPKVPLAQFLTRT